MAQGTRQRHLALGQMSKTFQVYFLHINFFKKSNNKIYNRAKKLYCDATIFVFFNSLLSTYAKKMETEKWPKAADSPLPIGSVSLFLHVFCVLRSFWQWNTKWNTTYSQLSENSQYFGADNLPQRHFFTCNRLTATMFKIFMLLTSPSIR